MGTTTCSDCNSNAWHEAKHTFGEGPPPNGSFPIQRYGPQPQQPYRPLPEVNPNGNSVVAANTPIKPFGSPQQFPPSGAPTQGLQSLLKGPPMAAPLVPSTKGNVQPDTTEPTKMGVSVQKQPPPVQTSVVQSNPPAPPAPLPPLPIPQRQSLTVPVQETQLSASQIHANDAANFNLLVQDPDGIGIQNSKIIVSGSANDRPLVAQNGPMMPGFAFPHPEMQFGGAGIEPGLVIAEKTINDITFNGTWRGELRHGSGTQTWPDGSVYEGGWREGAAFGLGRFKFTNGDVYEGQFFNDMANGKGILTRVDGSVADSTWCNDELHGVGKQVWQDGTKYEGNFHRGLKHGEGRYVWADGSEYTGEWQNNVITGRGRAYWSDGRRYDGEWLNNKKHGKGVHTWPDGRRYEGDYQYDTRQGLGVLTLPDGSKYNGQWFKNRRHGKGTETTSTGQTITGTWQHGTRIQPS